MVRHSGFDSAHLFCIDIVLGTLQILKHSYGHWNRESASSIVFTFGVCV
jgi:hypothetical protein